MIYNRLKLVIIAIINTKEKPKIENDINRINL